MSTYNLEKPIEGLLAALAANAPRSTRWLRPMPGRWSTACNLNPSPCQTWTCLLLPFRQRRRRAGPTGPSTRHQGITARGPLYARWRLDPGSFISHGPLARELAVGSNAIVAFVEYSLAPEARYPVQIKQCYAAAKWLTAHAAEHGIDSSRLAVRGRLSRREYGDGARDPGQAAR